MQLQKKKKQLRFTHCSQVKSYTIKIPRAHVWSQVSTIPFEKLELLWCDISFDVLRQSAMSPSQFLNHIKPSFSATIVQCYVFDISLQYQYDNFFFYNNQYGSHLISNHSQVHAHHFVESLHVCHEQSLIPQDGRMINHNLCSFRLAAIPHHWRISRLRILSSSNKLLSMTRHGLTAKSSSTGMSMATLSFM